jgi:hypothetical protein
MVANESKLLLRWRRAAQDLGFEVSGPVYVSLPSGVCIQAPLLVHRFGGKSGMLVLSDFSVVRDLTEELVRFGYGYSIMSEPMPEEGYSPEEFIDILADWGWSGSDQERPSWLK